MRTLDVSGPPATSRVHGPRCCPWSRRSRCSIERARSSSPAKSAASARLTCSSMVRFCCAAAARTSWSTGSPRPARPARARSRRARLASAPLATLQSGERRVSASRRGSPLIAASAVTSRFIEPVRDDRESLLVLGDERAERRLVDRGRREAERLVEDPAREPGARAWSHRGPPSDASSWRSGTMRPRPASTRTSRVKPPPAATGSGRRGPSRSSRPARRGSRAPRPCGPARRGGRRRGQTPGRGSRACPTLSAPSGTSTAWNAVPVTVTGAMPSVADRTVNDTGSPARRSPPKARTRIDRLVRGDERRRDRGLDEEREPDREQRAPRSRRGATRRRPRR